MAGLTRILHKRDARRLSPHPSKRRIWGRGRDAARTHRSSPETRYSLCHCAAELPWALCLCSLNPWHRLRRPSTWPVLIFRRYLDC